MEQKFIDIDVEERLIKLFDIQTELYAREVSGNCVIQNLQCKGWKELCDEAIMILREIR